MYDIIAAKRDGKALSRGQIAAFVDGVTDGSVPDYQISALLMAIFLRGMDADETAALTLCMADSGRRVDLSSVPGVKVDKHSTGGVGDKTTLIVVPLAAACGAPVAKMSGRGLGYTGGTIDKLAAIPGFRTDIAQEEFLRAVRGVGAGIIEAAGGLAPADKRLYAIRDVTATVESLPLIASSVMSKKLACGADRILLDVKAGCGAFMKTRERAEELARVMVDIGRLAGRPTAALVTAMDTPLGLTIGNALELREAFDILKGSGPEDLETLCVELAAQMLVLAELGDENACRAKARRALGSGAALSKLQALIEAQHGDPRVTEDYTLLPAAEYTRVCKSPSGGFVRRMRADMFGRASVALGAGRETKESAVDAAAGIALCKKLGDAVSRGEPLYVLHASDIEKLDAAEALLAGAVEIGDEPPLSAPLILSFVGA